MKPIKLENLYPTQTSYFLLEKDSPLTLNNSDNLSSKLNFYIFNEDFLTIKNKKKLALLKIWYPLARDNYFVSVHRSGIPLRAIDHIDIQPIETYKRPLKVEVEEKFFERKGDLLFLSRSIFNINNKYTTNKKLSEDYTKELIAGDKGELPDFIEVLSQSVPNGLLHDSLSNIGYMNLYSLNKAIFIRILK